MHMKPDCINCLMNQSLKVSKLLGLDDETSKKVLDRTAEILIEHDLSSTPPQIAKEIYQAISELTGKADPLAEAKQTSVEQALRTDVSFVRTLHDALKLSVIGNVIDFGAQKQFDLDEMIRERFHTPFTLDDYSDFEKELAGAKEIVILGDNTGEHLFDKILIEKIKERTDAQIFYFVRGKPIINDVTVKEAETIRHIAAVIDTGVETPGYDLGEANERSKTIFRQADIVISKGMGNFESLYQIAGRPVYYLFMVKCSVVAQAIGQNVGDMIFHRA